MLKIALTTEDINFIQLVKDGLTILEVRDKSGLDLTSFINRIERIRNDMKCDDLDRVINILLDAKIIS